MEWIQNATIARQSVHRKSLVMTSNSYRFFETGEILRSWWLIWQNGSQISIIAIKWQSSSFRPRRDQRECSKLLRRQALPEIEIWPPKPEILISLWKDCKIYARGIMSSKVYDRSRNNNCFPCFNHAFITPVYSLEWLTCTVREPSVLPAPTALSSRWLN